MSNYLQDLKNTFVNSKEMKSVFVNFKTVIITHREIKNPKRIPFCRKFVRYKIRIILIK